MISVVIPVFNEAATIGDFLKTLVVSNQSVEIIVVDGGSNDYTPELALAMGVRVFSSPPGRAVQMNFGASHATGDILLFLHADTFLPADYGAIVEDTLNQPNVIAGAFELNINDSHPALKLVEFMVNWRSRLFSLPYGDQALFLKSSVFHDCGGFPDLPIMEDFVFIRKLGKLGKVAIAPYGVLTSARRWQKLGIVKTTIINQLIILGYFLGVSPVLLAKLYQSFR